MTLLVKKILSSSAIAASWPTLAAKKMATLYWIKQTNSLTWLSPLSCQWLVIRVQLLQMSLHI